MAGTKIKDQFKELISPFLEVKIRELTEKFGINSPELNAINKQYVYSNLEKKIEINFEKPRHYQSEIKSYYDNKPLVGLERLYKNTILIEPTTVCAAHCRWCLRGQYPVKTMTKNDIINATKYIGTDERKEQLDEILITGGDPLMSLPLLEFTLQQIEKNASNIKTIRLASRVPFQDPDRINDKMLSIFSDFKGFRFELATHVNHPVEFWPESIHSLKKLQNSGFRIYNQNPLLKGVNDNLETLILLYQKLRDNNIESHYLFHAVPLRGMSHHRTTVKRGLDLSNALNSCGEFSGRAKPKFCLLTDAGKVVLYHDSIIEKRKSDNSILVKTGFNIENRLKWNPSWKKPESVEIDKDGMMYVWYLDIDEKDSKDIEKNALFNHITH